MIPSALHDNTAHPKTLRSFPIMYKRFASVTLRQAPHRGVGSRGRPPIAAPPLPTEPGEAAATTGAVPAVTRQPSAATASVSRGRGRRRGGCGRGCGWCACCFRLGDDGFCPARSGRWRGHGGVRRGRGGRGRRDRRLLIRLQVVYCVGREREGGVRAIFIVIFFMSVSQALGLREGGVRGMLGVVLERVLPATSAFPATPALERLDWLCWCPEMSMSMSMSMPAFVGSPGQLHKCFVFSVGKRRWLQVCMVYGLNVVCPLWAWRLQFHGLRVGCLLCYVM